MESNDVAPLKQRIADLETILRLAGEAFYRSPLSRKWHLGSWQDADGFLHSRLVLEDDGTGLPAFTSEALAERITATDAPTRLVREKT